MENYFGATLKEFRLKTGKSQQEIAEKIKRTQAQFSGYETGKSKPTIDTIILIAMVLEVDPIVFISAALKKSIYFKKCSIAEKFNSFLKRTQTKRMRTKKS